MWWNKTRHIHRRHGKKFPVRKWGRRRRRSIRTLDENLKYSYDFDTLSHRNAIKYCWGNKNPQCTVCLCASYSCVSVEAFNLEIQFWYPRHVMLCCALLIISLRYEVIIVRQEIAPRYSVTTFFFCWSWKCLHTVAANYIDRFKDNMWSWKPV